MHTLTQIIDLLLQPKYCTSEVSNASVILNCKSTLFGLSCGQGQLKHYSFHPCMAIQPFLNPSLTQQVPPFFSIPRWLKYYFHFHTYIELISSLLNIKKINHYNYLIFHRKQFGHHILKWTNISYKKYKLQVNMMPLKKAITLTSLTKILNTW